MTSAPRVSEAASPNAQQPRRKKRAPGRAAVATTRIVLFWERFWPAILPALAIPFVFIAFSLFDIWRLTPVWLHWTALGLGGLALVAMLARDLSPLRIPSRRAALARLEEDGRVAHAPLQALDDAPFGQSETDAALWRAHMKKSAERAKAARLAGVRATADARDPYAFRFTALGVFAVALIAAGEDWRERLAAGLSPSGTASGALVADLWIEPPAYTGKAPIYLLRAGETGPAMADQVDAPEGAVVVAQVNGRGRLRLDYATQADNMRAAFERNGAAARGEIALAESGLLRLRLGGREARWPIGVSADRTPSVSFIEEPSQTDDARLEFTVVVNDDYGIASAHLALRLNPDQIRPLDAPDFDAGALGEVRMVPLDGAAGAPGERLFALDLQSDPWAGLDVLAKVIVADGAGQTGETPEVSATLPERRFFNPLAKAVIEQRQTLAVAAEDWRRAGRSFDALTLAPEVFFEDTTDYLLLRTAFWRVMRQDGEGFDDAVEKFWPLALQLEDEALELARQRLEAAQEALRQALERDASDAEVERLVEELREAMNNYLQALAQSGQPMQGGPQQNAQQLGQSDLDEMLNAIRDLAQSGAANAARQMLSDLENLLNNLRLTQGGGGGGMPGQGGEGDGGPAGQAGEMIGRQRELADRSFERGQNPGEGGEEGSGEGAGALADEESALADDLNALLGALQGDPGADPNGAAARALGQALSEMREAEEALRNENFDAATSAMERAIAGLRDGAEELAREQMRQAQQGREGEGERGGLTDPLGRPAGRADGGGVDVPEETEAGRTRAVIEELRRRLGEQGRNEEEIDYLERLLERF